MIPVTGASGGSVAAPFVRPGCSGLGAPEPVPRFSSRVVAENRGTPNERKENRACGGTNPSGSPPFEGLSAILAALRPRPPAQLLPTHLATESRHFGRPPQTTPSATHEAPMMQLLEEVRHE